MPTPPTGPVPETICAMPWLNLSLDVDGTSRPCCKFAHLQADSPYQLANLRDVALEGVWNSDGMQRLREDFRAGVQPEECATCWKEEAAGIRSWRQTFRDDRNVRAEVDYDDLTPESPAALDLKLSNACNLKCRICGPVASSLWMQEELQHTDGPHKDWLLDNRSYFRANKITGDDDNLDTLRRWLPHLEHVEMTGGEPMFSPENREVIELISTEGRPEAVSLLLTTNATVIDDRIISALDRFGHVVISLSVDDIGPRLEVERAPCEWATVEANMHRYEAMAGPGLDLYVNCSISTLNVFYVPEIVRWFGSNLDATKVLVHLNMVHNPDHYLVQNLPGPLADVVVGRLEATVADTQISSYLRDQVSELISFIRSGTPDPAAWDAFIRITEERDRVRDESFARTFPELWDEIQRLGLWKADAEVDPPRSIGTAVRWLGRRVRSKAG